MTPGAARVSLLVAALLAARAALDAPGASAAPPREPPPNGAARLLYGAPLDANREPAEVLALLPRIGPARAHAIVAARPLCSLDDLDRVAGIGPVTLRTLGDRITFRARAGNCEQQLRALGD